MAIKLFDCKYCGAPIYDSSQNITWDDDQYVHSDCLEANQNKEKNNEHTH